MVKGVSRQVIVMPAPDPKLFEQAFFILRDDAVLEGVTEEQLLREAQAFWLWRFLGCGRVSGNGDCVAAERTVLICGREGTVI